MKAVIEVLHHLSRVLDINGGNKNQLILLTPESIDELEKDVFPKVTQSNDSIFKDYGNKFRFSIKMGGYNYSFNEIKLNK